MGLIRGKENLINIIIRNLKQNNWVFIIRPSLFLAPRCGRTNWDFIKLMTLVFRLHTFKFLGGTQDPLHTRPPLPTTSRSLVSPVHLCNITFLLKHDLFLVTRPITLECTTFSAKIATQVFSIYGKIDIRNWPILIRIP